MANLEPELGAGKIRRLLGEDDVAEKYVRPTGIRARELESCEDSHGESTSYWFIVMVIGGAPRLTNPGAKESNVDQPPIRLQKLWQTIVRRLSTAWNAQDEADAVPSYRQRRCLLRLGNSFLGRYAAGSLAPVQA